jgi:hypothetical protein
VSCGLINPNIFDTTIELKQQIYKQDFGQAMGQVQAPPCSAQMDTCSQFQGQFGADSQVRARCDTTRMLCYAEGSVTLTETVNLSEYAALQKGVDAVRTIEILYSLPVNTLTFPLPQIEIYAGPQGSKSKSDPGVVFIDKVGPFQKGQTISDTSPMRIVVPDGSAARNTLVGYIKNPKGSFVFLIVANPRVDADGSGKLTLPAGKIELRIVPRITVGLPR